jgi:sporulation protein YlmC with PRC-barrel domain
MEVPMPYLSTIVGTRIEDAEGERMGRVADVVAIPGSKFPVVRGLEVERG